MLVFDEPSQEMSLLLTLKIMFLVWEGPVLNDPSISIWPVKMFLVKTILLRMGLPYYVGKMIVYSTELYADIK